MTDEYLGWVQSGLTRQDGSGDLGRAITFHPEWWAPPKVQVTDDRLTFGWPDWADPPVVKRPNPEPLLDEFIELHDKDAAQFAVFAARWGPLYLCPACDGLFGHAPRTDCLEPPWYDGFPLSESLEVWRQYSLAARTLLNLAVGYREGAEDRQVDAWQTLLQLDALPLPFLRRPPARVRRWDLGTVVSDWLKVSEVRPLLLWFDVEPELTIRGFDDPLLGDIGMQLATAICGGHDLAVCDECGKPFTPSRRRAASRRAFCSDCGKSAAQKHASRAYRARRRGD